jgi:hypothetical protein
MRRAHRRLHLVIWLLLAPIALAASLYALRSAPQPQTTTLPDFIEQGE